MIKLSAKRGDVEAFIVEFVLPGVAGGKVRVGDAGPHEDHLGRVLAGEAVASVFVVGFAVLVDAIAVSKLQVLAVFARVDVDTFLVYKLVLALAACAFF